MSKLDNVANRLLRTNGWIYLAFFGVFFYIDNCLCGLSKDDYAYAFLWDGSDGGNLDGYIGNADRYRVESIQDIFLSLYSHYMTWGGRAVAHFFAQLFLWLGKPWFNLCNTGIYFLTVLLVYLLAGMSAKKRLSMRYFDPRIILLTLFLFWFCFVEFSSTNLWLTGACNYSWTACFRLVFLLPYVYAYFGKTTPWIAKLTSHFIFCAAFFCFGLIVGCTNENSALITIAIAAVLLVYSQEKKAVFYIGILGALLGYIFLIAAPGNFVRAETIRGTVMFMPLIGRLVMCAVMLLLLTPMFLLYRHRQEDKQHADVQIHRFLRVLTIGAVANIVMMLASPTVPLRSSYDSVIYMAIVLSAGIHLGWFSRPVHRLKRISLVCTVLLSVSVLCTVFFQFSYYTHIDKQFRDIVPASSSPVIIDIRYLVRHRGDLYGGSHILIDEWLLEKCNANRIQTLYDTYYGVDSVYIHFR